MNFKTITHLKQKKKPNYKQCINIIITSDSRTEQLRKITFNFKNSDDVINEKDNEFDYLTCSLQR